MTFAHFALIWPLIAIPLVAVTTLLLTGWLDRRERQRHRAAE
ncbi:MAG TPA: hypothetical protein VFB31_07275 [Pseudolabrys sp.]|nr:hypothetical protein [Pseudolabrys sp.]